VKRSLPFIALALAALLCARALGAAGAPPSVALTKQEGEAPAAKKPPRVTNMFYDTSLRQALSDIAAQTGVIIVPDMSVQGIVTCELKDVPLEEALRIVLSVGDFEFRRMDGYILVGSTRPDSPSFNKLSETRVVNLTYLAPEKAVKMLPEPFQRFAKAGPENGKVLVTAPRGLLDRIAADLKKLDQPPRHVLLDARVVVMERGRLQNLGVQWDWPQVLGGTFSTSELHGKDVVGSQWPWAVRIGLTQGRDFTAALLLTLNLLAQNDEAVILASPQVMAQDGKEAEIKVETEEFFIIVTEEQYARSELEKIGSGIIMKITPRIGENGDITLELNVEVSDVVARGENNLPVVTRRIDATANVCRSSGVFPCSGGCSSGRTPTPSPRARWPSSSRRAWCPKARRSRTSTSAQAGRGIPAWTRVCSAAPCARASRASPSRTSAQKGEPCTHASAHAGYCEEGRPIARPRRGIAEGRLPRENTATPPRAVGSCSAWRWRCWASPGAPRRVSCLSPAVR